QFAQTSGRLVAVQSARCDIQHQLLPSLAIGRWFDSVQSQEHDCRHHGGAFVSIEKWMVTANVKEICRCYIDEIGKGGLSAEARLRSQHGRGQQVRSEEHTSELQSRGHLVCRLLLEKKKKNTIEPTDRTSII